MTIASTSEAVVGRVTELDAIKEFFESRLEPP
jgi:hypothetical protein